MSKRIPCPSTECEEGIVRIYNAYAPDPLIPEETICELCLGHGYIFSSDEVALAN